MPTIDNYYYYLCCPDPSIRIPIVLIHGVGGNHLSWPTQIRRMPNHAIYALDLPGHGKSTGHGEQNLAHYAQKVAEWIQKIELKQIFLIGHSMGGAIALSLYHQFPRLVAGLGLVSTGARLPVNPVLIETTAHAATYHSALESILAWSFGPQTPQKIIDLVGQQLRKNRRSVLHGDLLACSSFDMTDELESITVPSLILCGERDKMTPLRFSQLLASKIPKTNLVVIPECGHMVMQENPEAVAAAIKDFAVAFF